MKITEQLILENKEFLDRVAIEVMKVYVSRQPPKGFTDSMSIARVAYRQSLALLEVRENELVNLAKEVKLLKNK